MVRKKYFEYRVPINLQNSKTRENIIASSKEDAKKRAKTVYKVKSFGSIKKLSSKEREKPKTKGVL